MFARELGVDIWSAIDAAGSKPFGFMQFNPGPGVGGHCLPVDPSYLAWRVERRLGHRFRFVELANEVNGRHAASTSCGVRRRCSTTHGRAVKGSRILLLGLAYKPGTSDWRESPAMTVARGLAALGADVRAHDAARAARRPARTGGPAGRVHGRGDRGRRPRRPAHRPRRAAIRRHRCPRAARARHARPPARDDRSAARRSRTR